LIKLSLKLPGITTVPFLLKILTVIGWLLEFIVDIIVITDAAGLGNKVLY